jgi:DNA repair protein SbcD/Mre11
MRILHTADWHIGRTFHGHQTMAALREVLGALADVVRDQRVDVVIAAGDIFDSAAPSGEAFVLLQETLTGIRDAGAELVLISGNHDSTARLGFAAPFARLGGVHIATDPGAVGTPLTLSDEHGPVDFYCVPFLEPALIRHRWPEVSLRSQADALRFAMGRIRATMAQRSAAGARSVVVSHTFAAGGEVESSESERAIANVGTVDVVPLSTFDGVDYVALGHIHGRAKLANHIRYSGAMLHYSFSEAGKPRGGWLVELGAEGMSGAEWIDLPVPRPLVVLKGELEDLLSTSELEQYRDHWVSALLTDSSRPIDAMRRLQARFAWCAHVEHRPVKLVGDGASSYAERVQGKSDEQVLEAFLRHVRNGEGLTDSEAELFEDVVSEHRGVMANL